MDTMVDQNFLEPLRRSTATETICGVKRGRLIHRNPQFLIITRPFARHRMLRRYSASHRTKTGHSPRQRKNGPDHKLPVQEVAMAEKADTRIPRERQDDRYSRAVPIGQVVHNILTDLAKKVGK